MINNNFNNTNQVNSSFAGVQNVQGDTGFQQYPSMPPAGQEQFGRDDVRRIAEKDLMTIQNLAQTGKIDSAQEQYLVNYVLNKAYNMVNNQNARNVQQDSVPVNGIAEFEKERRDFFNLDGRNEVLEYLKNSNVNFDKDEVSLISQMIEKLENSAVDRYLKQIAREKTLNDENENAKKRLRANAQNSNFDDNKNRVFTREQIGKMSGAEFARYEKAIMEQLRKGLIR